MAMEGKDSNEVGGRGGRSPSNGWLSNVVYSASRLSIMFNYAFGKPLPKPALPPPVGISENGFMTPRSRGLLALCSMACTPYSRLNPSNTMKGVTSTLDVYGGSSSSQSALEQNRISGSKQGLLKRRSSVLDSNIGSVGPILRIIRTTILRTLMENGDNSRPGISFAHVPSQSTEMAEKILQQLDKLAPSPKEKSSQLKLAAAKEKEKSPAKLSPSMLRGQALKSLESVPSVKNADYAMNCVIHYSPTEKKWAFQTSVHKDYVELDDDFYPNGLVCNPLIESREKLDKPLLDRKETAETSGTHVAAEKNTTAFTFPVAPVSSMTVQPVGLASQPSSTFDTVVVPLKELNAAPPPPPVFSFDSKDHVKKAPPFTFSSLPPPAVVESFGAFSEPKSYGGPSSSQSALEQNRISGSKQGLLKRKSSVLDSDIGSVGPIRGIRHKPNLLSSKSSRTAIGGSPLSEKSLFSSILNKSSDAETSGTQVAPVSSMTVQPVGLASSTFDTVVVPLKELNAAPPPPPVFSFDSKDHVKKAPPFTFSKFGAFSEPKPESSSSFASVVSACATEAMFTSNQSVSNSFTVNAATPTTNAETVFYLLTVHCFQQTMKFRN